MEREHTEQDIFESDAGYSEKQQALDAEIQAGEWHSLRKYKTYQQRSRQWKIIATYKAVSNRLNQLVELYYKLVRDHPQKSEKLLEELRNLRLMQDILVQCMVWEPAGELSKDRVPQ